MCYRHVHVIRFHFMCKQTAGWRRCNDWCGNLLCWLFIKSRGHQTWHAKRSFRVTVVSKQLSEKNVRNGGSDICICFTRPSWMHQQYTFVVLLGSLSAREKISLRFCSLSLPIWLKDICKYESIASNTRIFCLTRTFAYTCLYTKTQLFWLIQEHKQFVVLSPDSARFSVRTIWSAGAQVSRYSGPSDSKLWEYAFQCTCALPGNKS
jgi:hypothetical protein